MKLNMKKKTWKNIVQYAILIIVGIIMVYPLVWMCFAVFKTNAEIFSSAAIFPKKWVFDAFDGLENRWVGRLHCGNLCSIHI